MDKRRSARSISIGVALLTVVGVLLAAAPGAIEHVYYDGPRLDLVLTIDVCVNPEITLDGVIWETNDRIPEDWSDAEVDGVFQTNGGDRARFTSSDGRISLRYRAVTSEGGFSERDCFL